MAKNKIPLAKNISPLANKKIPFLLKNNLNDFFVNNI